MTVFEYIDEYKLKKQKIDKDYVEYWLVKGDIDGYVQILHRGQAPHLAYEYYHNDFHKNPLYKIVKVSQKIEHILSEKEIQKAQKELDNW